MNLCCCQSWRQCWKILQTWKRKFTNWQLHGSCHIPMLLTDKLCDSTRLILIWHCFVTWWCSNSHQYSMIIYLYDNVGCCLTGIFKWWHCNRLEMQTSKIAVMAIMSLDVSNMLDVCVTVLLWRYICSLILPKTWTLLVSMHSNITKWLLHFSITCHLLMHTKIYETLVRDCRLVIFYWCVFAHPKTVAAELLSTSIG